MADLSPGPANCREALSKTSPITSVTTGTKKSFSPSAAAYVERIHAVPRSHPSCCGPPLPVTSAFSGGQTLKNIAQKAMNMEGDAGLRFHVFDDIADEKAFKTTYRSAGYPSDQSGHGRSDC